MLDRAFEQLAPRLRAAQKGFRDYAKLAEARRKSTPVGASYMTPLQDSPHTYWNRIDMRQLVDDCLNIRCLDPAMGSGHFLVEVVDYVSNRLIRFLNGWSENPVWAFIEQTRDDILGEMERQHVSIDAERLTRVALLKRAVLKRCVYGVDLNEMAVELAKVSLWLDAFTLGAPLSFLDHHLKHGNSLIGARVKDVQAYLKASDQIDMFSGSKFAGVMLATDLMRQVSYLSDNTVEQTRRSAEAYRDASDHLAPYKRLLDVYTSRWFGNAPAKKAKTDTVRLFLQEAQTEAWLQNPNTPLDNRLIPAETIAQTALQAASDKRFFHWELEFPEVFFAPSTPGGQEVQLREGGGFDAVVGNPPYDELSKEALGREVVEKDYLQQVSTFQPTQNSGGRSNWYHFFMILSLDLSHPGGRTGMIVPMSWMGDSFTYGVRKWMLENHLPVIVEAFPQKDDARRRVFFDAKLPTSIYVAEKNRSDGVICARVHPGKDILDSPYYKANLTRIEAISPESLVLPLVKPQGWALLNELAFSDRIGTLAEIAAEPTSGEIIFNAATWPYMTDDSSFDLILRGSHVQRYELAEVAKQGEPEYLKTEEYLKSSTADSKAYAHRTDRIVYQEGSAIDAWRRVVSTHLPAGHICGHKICYFVKYKVDKFALLAIFGSNLINWLVEKLSVTNSLPAYLIGNLPFPKITFTTPAAERAQIVQQAIARYDAGDNAALLAQTQAAIDTDKTDVVHDLLAHLAQRMIDLNKQKQAEVKRFLDWLEARLKIRAKGDAGKEGREPSMYGRDISRPHDANNASNASNANPEGRDISRPHDANNASNANNANPEGRDISRPHNASNASNASNANPEGRDISRPHNASNASNASNENNASNANNASKAGIDSLTGKSILQNYLGDYQKNEKEQPWREFFYRLHQNRNRFAASLSDAEGEIEREYQRSLASLLPIKRELARTDTLIDKIVYRLYGLTDAEIELIERPQYEQALADAKARVVADKEIAEEDKLDKIAENILPATERFFERIEPKSDEELLDTDLPGWRALPPAAPTFLLTGDYNLRTLPEQMDFSTCIISYTKAVEVALFERIFAPFRATSGYTDADCKNTFLKDFMIGKKHLTLGSFGIILKSTEPALRAFISSQIHDAAERIFGASGAVARLNDDQMVQLRNKAAHDEVLSRAEAQAIRGWALDILGQF